MTNIVVTSAKSLSDTEKNKLEAAFAEKYKDFQVRYVIEARLIGGMTIFDGTSMFDDSIYGKLHSVGDKIKEKI